jgi:hypothetical protein
VYGILEFLRGLGMEEMIHFFKSCSIRR